MGLNSDTSQGFNLLPLLHSFSSQISSSVRCPPVLGSGNSEVAHHLRRYEASIRAVHDVSENIKQGNISRQDSPTRGLPKPDLGSVRDSLCPLQEPVPIVELLVERLCARL